MKIGGVEIKLTNDFCGLNGQPGQKKEMPAVNIYVRMTDFCVSDCEFCTFHGVATKAFDFYKFFYAFCMIAAQCKINKVSFTGGEPMLHVEAIKRCLEFIKQHDKNIYTVINTQSYDAMKLLGDAVSLVDSVAMSVHHYEDSLNNCVFNSKHKIDDIFEYGNLNKVHLSCNLILGYIDSSERVQQYVSHFMSRGIMDFGFVTLMPVNDYAKENCVKFTDLDLARFQDFVKTKDWCRGNDICRCANYLVTNSRGDIAKVYARHHSKSDVCENTLVYDINQLRNGFVGEAIF